MKKIIEQGDRLILIKQELTDEDYWESLFEGLTFNEGLAMMNAFVKFTSKFKDLLPKEKDDLK